MDIPPEIMNPIMLFIMPAIPDNEGDDRGKDTKRFSHIPKRNCPNRTMSKIKAAILS